MSQSSYRNGGQVGRPPRPAPRHGPMPPLKIAPSREAPGPKKRRSDMTHEERAAEIELMRKRTLGRAALFVPLLLLTFLLLLLLLIPFFLLLLLLILRLQCQTERAQIHMCAHSSSLQESN